MSVFEKLSSGELERMADDAGAGKTGSVEKTGAGALTLTGSNSYTGGTTVTAGRLNVDGALAGDAQVGNWLSWDTVRWSGDYK